MTMMVVVDYYYYYYNYSPPPRPTIRLSCRHAYYDTINTALYCTMSTSVALLLLLYSHSVESWQHRYDNCCKTAK